jgi:molecular chaperone GrpE
VIRDRRRVDPSGERAMAQPTGTGSAADAGPRAGSPVDQQAAAGSATSPAAGESAPAGEPAGSGAAGSVVEAGGFAAELAALRAEVDERTRDLQRVTAEYANYRKRVERDRILMAEQATAVVLMSLLPILDDLDRARDHGDLVGPFGSVAEHLTTALAKYGLAPFGEKGDLFDPQRHEAVTHEVSTEVSEPTCIEIMRRGYLLGDRLLRPALVAVADPA